MSFMSETPPRERAAGFLATAQEQLHQALMDGKEFRWLFTPDEQGGCTLTLEIDPLCEVVIDGQVCRQVGNLAEENQS